ncbi:MAG: hypothetical protein ACRBDI_02290 [Alphaproteobacteria bacterium]
MNSEASIVHSSNFSNPYSLTNLWRALNRPQFDNSPPAPPNIAIPDDWDIFKHSYQYDHLPQESDIYHSPSRTNQTKGTIFYSLGWKTHPLEKLSVIEDLQHSGYDVIIMPLVESHNKIGTMAENITRMGTALFDENSIIHDLKAPDSPLFVMTHSTSATVFEMAQLNAKSINPYNIPRIDLVVHTNPFINARGASEEENPILSKIYKWHANRHFNEHAGVPLLDRAFYFTQGLTEQLIHGDPRGRPTHGQVLEISSYGNRLLKSRNFAERSDPPIVAYLSSNDDFADPKTAKKYFNTKPNTRHIYIEEAGHNILLQDNLRSKIIDLFDAEDEKYSADIRSQYDTPPPTERHTDDHPAL